MSRIYQSNYWTYKNHSHRIEAIEFYDSDNELPFQSVHDYRKRVRLMFDLKKRSYYRIVPRGHDIVGLRCNDEQGIQDLTFVLWAPPKRHMNKLVADECAIDEQKIHT